MQLRRSPRLRLSDDAQRFVQSMRAITEGSDPEKGVPANCRIRPRLSSMASTSAEAKRRIWAIGSSVPGMGPSTNAWSKATTKARWPLPPRTLDNRTFLPQSLKNPPELNEPAQHRDQASSYLIDCQLFCLYRIDSFARELPQSGFRRLGLPVQSPVTHGCTSSWSPRL
jgi:hypothetical protein